MHCIRCGKSGLFLRVDDAMHCKACAEQIRQEEEGKRKEQEEALRQERNAQRNRKLIEARVYYENLCSAYQRISGDLLIANIVGQSHDVLASKDEACRYLIKELPLWKTHELFAEVYWNDAKPHPQLPGQFMNPRLPAGSFRKDAKPNFEFYFSDLARKAGSLSTKILLADSANVAPSKAKEPLRPENAMRYQVVGIKYYLPNVLRLASRNQNYGMTKGELIDIGVTEENIWKYEFHPKKVELIPEPDNPHDPNAIKVVVDGEHIGYVKAESCAAILKAIRNGSIQHISCSIGGGPYKCIIEDYDFERDREKYTLRRDEQDYTAAIYITENAD